MVDLRLVREEGRSRLLKGLSAALLQNAPICLQKFLELSFFILFFFKYFVEYCRAIFDNILHRERHNEGLRVLYDALLDMLKLVGGDGVFLPNRRIPPLRERRSQQLY